MANSVVMVASVLEKKKWEDTDGAIVGFQLAYDKYRNERSFTWAREHGFTHYVVDDGEARAEFNDTPLLHADGPFAGNELLDRFISLAAEEPPEIVAFVTAKIREYAQGK